MPSDAPPILSVSNLTRSYQDVHVLRGGSTTLTAGSVVALVGPSGCGKTTLLQLAGLLDTPSSGQVILNGIDCSRLSDRHRTGIRRESIGFVYQFHHLLPEFNAWENVALTLWARGQRGSAVKKQAWDLLDRVKLLDRKNHRVRDLSGGEAQRVAIARSLIGSPRLILADEPTGNLDPQIAATVFDLLAELCREQGTATLTATHNLELASRCDARITIRDGIIQPLPEPPVPTPRELESGAPKKITSPTNPREPWTPGSPQPFSISPQNCVQSKAQPNNPQP